MRESEEEKDGVHPNALLKLSWLIHSTHFSEDVRANEVSSHTYFLLWLQAGGMA